MNIDPNDVPEEWLEDVPPLDDTVAAVFLHESKRTLYLVTRVSPGVIKLVAPIAISPSGNVRLITSLKVTGFFSKSVELELRSQDGVITGLKIPLSSLERGYEDSASKFFAWAGAFAPSVAMMRPPSFMFHPVKFN